MEHLLFAAKKLVTMLAMPLGAWLIATVSGLAFRLCRPRSRIGLWLIVAGGAWLYVCSVEFTGFMLIHSLENEAGSYADPAQLEQAGVKHIVVLGGPSHEGDSLTVADRVAGSIPRVLEGIRLWRQIPGAKLVTSGGTYRGSVPIGQAMADLAMEMGVPGDSVRVEHTALDTEDEALLLAPRLKGRPFALVTSAYHMPRSLLQFRRCGLDPIPAPAGFQAGRLIVSAGCFLPSAAGLGVTDVALREYTGRCWALLKMRFKR
ncbi:MAG: ElyC/SanA/YdcF family protein [Thermodesulfobacteriota bacterium]